MSTKKSYRDLQKEIEILLEKQEALKKTRAEIMVKEIVKSEVAEDLADMSEAQVKAFAKFFASEMKEIMDNFKKLPIKENKPEPVSEEPKREVQEATPMYQKQEQVNPFYQSPGNSGGTY